MPENGDPSTEEGELDSIDVIYSQRDEYEVLPATGARGGVQAQGNFKLDFTLDINNDPAVETYAVEEGGFGEVLDWEGGDTITRQKQVGVSLSQNHAYSVAVFIISNLFGSDVSDHDVDEALRTAFAEKFD